MSRPLASAEAVMRSEARETVDLRNPTMMAACSAKTRSSVTSRAGPVVAMASRAPRIAAVSSSRISVSSGNAAEAKLAELA